MRRHWVLACLFAGLSAAGPARAESFTLSEALAAAYESNPKLAGARAALDALDQGVAQANAGWRPSVNANESYGVNHGTIQNFPTPFDSHPLTGQVTVSEPLFRGGRTYAEIGRAKAEVRAGRADLTATEESVLLDAVTAYMDVLRDAEILHANQANVEALQDEANAVAIELSAGEVTKTDVLQAQARLAKANADEASAEQQLVASRAAFENVVGRPAEILSMPAFPRVPSSQDNALDLALSRNPTLISTKESARAADYAVDDATGALLPEVSVSGQYQYLKDSAGTNIFATKSPQQIVSVLGQLNVPIYQGGGDEAAVRRAKDLRGQSVLAIASAEHDVRQEVQIAWHAFGSAQTAIAADEAQVDADNRALDGVKQEKQGGERSVLDVLNAQQELLGAEVSASNSRHDAVVAAYRILSATGQLTAQALGLKVQLYDPGRHYRDNANAWFGLDD